MENHSPAITRENEILTLRLEELREEYAEHFSHHKEMVESELVILNSLYLQKLGHLQLELLQKQTESARLKMKMQQIQAAINRDEKPDLNAIDAMINRRLEEYHQEIAMQAASLDASKQVLSNLVSEEDTEKLKEIFRVLCKRLHPDLNPNQSYEEKDLFIKVKAAYDLNALQELQMILLYLDDQATEKLNLVSMPEKQQRIEHLERSIGALHEKIESLEQSFPFNHKHLIMDDEWIRVRQEEIRSHIAVFEENIEKFNNIISLLCDE
jgi:hypothetical protein